MSDAPPKVVVVVPTYNERENLPRLAEQLNDLGIANLHLLVVDDNSPDGTGEVAEKLALEAEDRIGVLHRTSKDGIGRAYVAGMTRALAEDADVVIQMDADLSHPTSVIPAMLAALAAGGADVVIGSRYVPGGEVAQDWPRRRKLLSAFANVYVEMILRLKVKDVTAGYKAWSASALRTIDVSTVGSDGYAFQVEMNYRAVKRGLRIAEVPIRFEERAEGASKMTLAVQLESARMPWRLRFGRRP